MDGTERTGVDPPAVQVQTFLIADICGYSTFTEARGDEAGAHLASTFAARAGEVVQTQGGALIEVRGDEVLAVFASPRQALRAAADLQEAVAAYSDTPFEIGVGIDAGEAVPVDSGYRGGALNIAARLCSLAGPGRILTTDVVSHLARKVEGLRYDELGPMPLKGMTASIRVVEVRREGAQLVPASKAQLPVQVPRTLPFGGFSDGWGEALSHRIEDQVQTMLAQSFDSHRTTLLRGRGHDIQARPETIHSGSSVAPVLVVAVVFGSVVTLALIVAAVIVVIVLHG